MFRRMVVLVGCLGLTYTQPGYGQGLDAFAVAASQATETLQRAIDARVVGSAIGLIARRDQILVLYSGGEIGSGEPMPVNAIARMASIQKPITAAAVLMLYERGQLDLQASVDDWFPGFVARVVEDRPPWACVPIAVGGISGQHGEWADLRTKWRVTWLRTSTR